MVIHMAIGGISPIRRLAEGDVKDGWFWFCVNSGFHYMRPTICNGAGVHKDCGPRQRPKGGGK